MLPEGPEVPQCLRALEELVAVLVHEHKDASQMNKQADEQARKSASTCRILFWKKTNGKRWEKA